MHLITPYSPWSPKKNRTWQDEAWEQQQIAEIEAKTSEKTEKLNVPENLPQNIRTYTFTEKRS